MTSNRKYWITGSLVLIMVVAVWYFYYSSTSYNSGNMIDVYCVSDNCVLHLLNAGAGTLAQGCYRSQNDCMSTLSTTTSSQQYTISTSSSQSLGTFLVDLNGMTLYSFTKDTAGNDTSTPVSACTGACLTKWPVFYSQNIIVPNGLNPNDFSSFVRPDGTPQTTYKGWPLYYYSNDTNTGDTNGQGVGGVWSVVNP